MSAANDTTRAFLDTVPGESSFFRSVMRARPVGKFREFHVLTIRNWIQRDTGELVTPSAIWDKLNVTWNLKALEDLVSTGTDLPQIQAEYESFAYYIGRGRNE